MKKEYILNKAHSLSEKAEVVGKIMPKSSIIAASIDMAEWVLNNLWKPADGDDFPEMDREVIVLVQDYPDDKDHLRVAFAHRPSRYTKVWNSDLGEEQVVEIERYDKGGWNIPNVKYWLDVEFPKEIEP